MNRKFVIEKRAVNVRGGYNKGVRGGLPASQGNRGKGGG